MKTVSIQTMPSSTMSSPNTAALGAAAAQKPELPIRTVAVAMLVAAFALLPAVAAFSGQGFYLTLVSRIMIFGLAALGLNLVLGFGAMVSMGHALYFGIGAYAVGMLASHGINSGPLQLFLALGVGLISATVIGLVCLRSSGVAFIMITLAFAQMFYYLAVGLKAYGGDDGLPILVRSQWPLLDLDNAYVLYYLIFALLMGTLFVFHRLIHSRFGMLLRGCQSNERRMRALGFATLRYKLTAYVISALVCVVAGMLFANLTRFASPSYLQWTVSGELISMIVLGGMSTLVGPIVGAAIWVVLEELLTSFRIPLPGDLDALLRDHWMLLFGLFIIVVTMSLKQGLYGRLVEGGSDQS